MIPLRDENPSSTTPVVTRLLIAVNLVVFLYELTLGPRLQGFVYEFGVIPDHLALAIRGAAPLGPTALTVLTSMFLHGGWMHVLGNMWYLWIFGDNVEDRLGHVGFLIFYLLAGVAAATLHAVMNAHSTVPTLGASGAIAGVLGAYIIAFPGARVFTLVPLWPFVQVIPLPAVLVLGLWILFQFLAGTFSPSMGAAGSGVAWWAHVGGFGFGVLVMLLFGGGRRSRKSRAWVQE